MSDPFIKYEKLHSGPTYYVWGHDSLCSYGAAYKLLTIKQVHGNYYIITWCIKALSHTRQAVHTHQAFARLVWQCTAAFRIIRPTITYAVWHASENMFMYEEGGRKVARDKRQLVESRSRQTTLSTLVVYREHAPGV